MTGLLLVLLVVALVVALVLTNVSTRRRIARRRAAFQGPVAGARGSAVSARYTRKQALLSGAERAYFSALEPVAQQMGLYVACKTRLADLVSVPRDADNRIALTNRISQKHVDFVLCERSTMAPVVVIDLDDGRDEQARDAIFAAAELPLLRVRVQRAYVVTEVHRTIAQALSDHDFLAEAA